MAHPLVAHTTPATPGRRWTTALALGTLTVLLLVAIGAPWLAPYDPTAQLDLVALKNRAPSWSHWLGTDAYARDVLSRALFGARTSLAVASLSTTIAVALGTAWGAGAASAPPRLAQAMMGLVDVLRSLPRLLLLLGALVALGTMTPAVLAVVLGLTSWTGISRLVFMKIRALDAGAFVEGARALGLSRTAVLRRHIAPHLAAPLGAAAPLLLADLLAVESGLSFLGLGVRPPLPSWGNMVQDAVPFLQSAWWLVAVPCVLIMATVLSASSVADRLGDTLMFSGRRTETH
jgi:peptide/nickel transport system permease protein